MFFSLPKNNLADTLHYIPELKKSFQHKNQGIPENDLCALSNYVQEKNIVLLIRPVDPLSRSLHATGKFPTKSFNIKAKTASWGAWASFIPIDQAYGKLHNADAREIEKTNQDTKDCITQKFAQTVHLSIDEKRFKELREAEVIYPQRKKEGKYIVLYCPRPPDNNTFELCYAKKIKVGSETKYFLYTAKKKPFLVLADMVLNRPFIADYDLLAIFLPWRNFSQNTIRPNPDIILEGRHRKLSPREQRRSMENAKNFYGRELPNLGNITQETLKIINELNSALNKTGPLACFHHNDDAGSPASCPTVNYPMTVLLPKLSGFPSLLRIASVDEFMDFIEKIKQLDYRVEANPLWEQVIQLTAKEDFYQKIISLERNNPEKLKNSLKEILKSIGITDSTLIQEITHIVLTMRCHLNIELGKFFKIIKSCLLINSILVTQWCAILDKLLSKNLLTHENFLKIQDFIQKLKDDIPGFSKLSLALINFDTLKELEHIRSERKLHYLFNLAEECIQENKLDQIQFDHLLSENLIQLSLDPPEKASLRLGKL